ncbi:MAG: hypothetical protein ACE37J_02580 [Pikeienuella sp.]|uniref:hypothetical protein n=1 Tax=Pikeienuella sp. TaxID=2831957 RepID=UPI0039199D02
MLLQILLSIGLGLPLILAWALGWRDLALALYVIGFTAKAAGALTTLVKLSRGVTFDPDYLEASFAIATSARARRLMMADALAALGAAAAWPIHSLIGGLAGMTLANATGDAPLSRLQIGRYIMFRYPPALLCLAAYVLQSLFMLFLMPPGQEPGLAYKAVVAIQILGFIAFSAHFFGRRTFTKNFSASAIGPLLFAALATALAVLAAITIRMQYRATFAGAEPAFGVEPAFQMLRGILANTGLLDIGETIRDATSFADFRNEVSGYVLGMDALRALDLFLGFGVVFTFTRGLWSAIRLERDADDRRARVWSFLTAGRARDAAAEAERQGRDDAAFTLALCALFEADYATFARRLSLSGPDAEFKAAGDAPWVCEYTVLSHAYSTKPLPREAVNATLEGYWRRHARIAPTLALAANLASTRRVRMREVASEPERYDFMRLVAQAADVMDARLEDGGDLANSVFETYGRDAVSVLLLMSVWAVTAAQLPRFAEKREAIRNMADAAHDAIERRLAESGTVEPISFAFLPFLYAATGAYRAAFHDAPDRLERLIRLYETAMEAAGTPVPALYRSLGRARYRFA